MRLFPNAKFVPITVFPTDDKGLIFDGPPDNATWPQVVDWVVLRRRSGAIVTVYTDGDQWSTGKAAFAARGVAEPLWWIATWNGQQTIPAGAIGHQYAGDASGGFDQSIVADYWPGVDAAPSPKPPPPAPKPAPQPAPSPAPTSAEDEEMLLVSVTPSGTDNPGIWILSGSLYAHVTDVPTASALLGAGVKQASISYAQHQSLLSAAAALQGKLSGSLAVQGSLNVAGG